LLWCRSCRLCCMATFEKKWKMLEWRQKQHGGIISMGHLSINAHLYYTIRYIWKYNMYIYICNIVLLPIHPIKESHKTSTAQGTKSKLAMHSFTSQASDSPTTLPASAFRWFFCFFGLNF
jgi:hypothetical protein